MFLSLYKSEIRCVKEGTISIFSPVCVLLELHREREGMAAMSSSMIFFAGMEKERGRGRKRG